MKKWIIIAVIAVIASGCGRSNSKRETPTTGNATIMVDETFSPVIKGIVQVFENQYRNATFNVLAVPEFEISELLRSDSLRLAVLSRPLTASEEATFTTLRIQPKTQEIGYDGIALITNLHNSDTLVRTKALRPMLQGDTGGRILVFDNPASSNVRFMSELTGVDTMIGIYSLNTNLEVIEYVKATPNAIGFVGVDWLYEPDGQGGRHIDHVRVMSVGDDETGFFKPTQNDIAEGKYPLTRKVYFVNAQGTAGLGMGFASFVAGDQGQRIILKSGLVPVTFPKREIVIRTQL